MRRSSRARRLRVTIDPRRGVVVAVPASKGSAASLRAVESFLAEREPWLRRHLASDAAVLARLAAFGPPVDGAIVTYLGQPHRLRVRQPATGRRRTAVLRVGSAPEDELEIALGPRDRRPLRDILVAWFRERARTEIQRAIARHAPSLGVAPAGVTVRDQQTRWGSASRKGRLSFSWRLVLAPPAVLDSVVVHELAHLRVFGHGDRFWAVVASRCPDYRTQRRWLRQHSLELHAALDADRFLTDNAV